MQGKLLLSLLLLFAHVSSISVSCREDLSVLTVEEDCEHLDICSFICFGTEKFSNFYMFPKNTSFYNDTCEELINTGITKKLMETKFIKSLPQVNTLLKEVIDFNLQCRRTFKNLESIKDKSLQITTKYFKKNNKNFNTFLSLVQRIFEEFRGKPCNCYDVAEVVTKNANNCIDDNCEKWKQYSDIIKPLIAKNKGICEVSMTYHIISQENWLGYKLFSFKNQLYGVWDSYYKLDVNGSFIELEYGWDGYDFFPTKEVLFTVDRDRKEVYTVEESNNELSYDLFLNKSLAGYSLCGMNNKLFAFGKDGIHVIEKNEVKKILEWDFGNYKTLKKYDTSACYLYDDKNLIEIADDGKMINKFDINLSKYNNLVSVTSYLIVGVNEKNLLDEINLGTVQIIRANNEPWDDHSFAVLNGKLYCTCVYGFYEMFFKDNFVENNGQRVIFHKELQASTKIFDPYKYSFTGFKNKIYAAGEDGMFELNVKLGEIDVQNRCQTNFSNYTLISTKNEIIGIHNGTISIIEHENNCTQIIISTQPPYLSYAANSNSIYATNPGKILKISKKGIVTTLLEYKGDYNITLNSGFDLKKIYANSPSGFFELVGKKLVKISDYSLSYEVVDYNEKIVMALMDYDGLTVVLDKKHGSVSVVSTYFDAKFVKLDGELIGFSKDGVYKVYL